MPMPIDEQVALLMQGTEYGDETLRRTMEAELRERLQEGRPLRVYLGVDPRTSDLHLGHTVPLRKLRQFQDLGHETILLIGTFTALVGDPSDQLRGRALMSPEEVEANARTYAEQAFRVLDPQKTIIRYNAEWLSKLAFADLIHLASHFTVQQFLARESFAERLKSGDPIFLHETFYPLMQGYDAVALQADVQIGGTDQLFNIVVAGRKLQEAFGQRPQVAILLPLLPGTDGVRKMSKSLGNHIPLNTTPEDMFGKVMSIPDEAMSIYFKLVTRYPPPRIAAIEEGLRSGSLHPRDVKMELAREIVSIFFGEEAAERAEAHFRTVFQERAFPEEMPAFSLAGPQPLVDLMVAAGLAPSRSEARRLIRQGGVRLDGETVSDVEAVVTIDRPKVLQVGRRRFVRLLPKGD
ncbi:MAG: tyrosine--tRNA ligase [Thermoflexus sp.]|nr:tyrosine--tRNA ligase [Thermoflexus sp.]MCS7351086.1 tyrosine--tRNA ligase [Thermoflexus sp.]